jgi:hypothetical protein
MKKVLSVLSAMVFGFVGLFALGISAAQATEYGWAYFETEDGKWDRTFSTTSTYNDVEVALDYPLTTIPGSYPVDGTIDVKVRLCNASTGNCTSYKLII